LFPWQSLLVAAQELNIATTTAARARQKSNFFIISFKLGQQINSGKSKELAGRIQCIFVENENNIPILFLITFDGFFLRFFAKKSLIIAFSKNTYYSNFTNEKS